MENIQLKKGKEKSILHRHPWLFSGAIDRQLDGLKNGDLVKINNSEGKFLAYGYFNGQSKISVRVLDWDENAKINKDWWKLKIQHSIEKRNSILADKSCNSVRLIYSESDKLPGLIVDKYDQILVVQFLTLGIEMVKEEIIEILSELVKPKLIIEKSDAPARLLEGLQPIIRIAKGKESESLISILENNLKFWVDANLGQKSGYYLDQRENRKIVASYAKDKKVLDCFCYSGGFSIHALQAGATSVTGVDSSETALNAFEENLKLNNFTNKEVNLVEQDVFNYLRSLDKNTTDFDLIILDPPKLAPSRSSVDKAKKAYKELNLQAMKVLKSGGILATFSCSSAIDLETFKQIISWAATDAGVDVQFMHYFGQPIDHPILSSFPESEYLKGILCKIL